MLGRKTWSVNSAEIVRSPSTRPATAITLCGLDRRVQRRGSRSGSGGTGRPGRASGRVETIVSDVSQEHGLRPERTVVYICGNPEMIINVETELMHRGFPEFHVKKELYWPKGKDAALFAG